MEETPICDSVERDLAIAIDELLTGTVAIAGPGEPEPAVPAPH